MPKFAVVKTGGKQYLVKESDEITVDRLPNKEKDEVELETLLTFDPDGEIDLGLPSLTKKTKASVLLNMLGDKVRIAKFKSKVRYRKVRGFRASLTKLKIGKIM